MNRIFLPSFFLALSVLVLGCQSDQQRADASRDRDATPASASTRTPDGDNLNGPIPYGHWPYNIDHGGGGGTSR